MNVWPLPNEYTEGTGVVWMSSSVDYLYTSIRLPQEEFDVLWADHQLQRFVLPPLLYDPWLTGESEAATGLCGRKNLLSQTKPS